MSNELITKTEECISTANSMEWALTQYLGELWLPNDNIFVLMDERAHFFNNAPYHLNKLDISKKNKAIYLSKFFAAVSSWLFDAALNYLWNETINDLRNKIIKFNLDFFISTIDISDKKRKDLNDTKDLSNLWDYDLIKWARKISLVSEIGFKELEHINYMRNWASAAHYNNADLTATKLLHYFEVCLKEVISLPTPVVIADINKFFNDIKDRELEKSNLLATISSFKNLRILEKENLINGLFWIYIDEQTKQFSIENINNFIDKFDENISDEAKEEIWLRYYSYKASNEEYKEKKSREFLELIKWIGFIPDNIRVNEIKIALDELLSAHYANDFTNFQTEPIFANQLEKIVWEYWKVPQQIKKQYVEWIVNVFLTNWHSNAWNADPYYIRMIKNFDISSVKIAIISFLNSDISLKLQYSISKSRYIEMLEMIEWKVINENIKVFIGKIKKYKNWLDKLISNNDFKKEIKNLKLYEN